MHVNLKNIMLYIKISQVSAIQLQVKQNADQTRLFFVNEKLS